MAEIKKYLDATALGTLVAQIKAEDNKVKAYADAQIEAAGNLYDVAGAAATVQGKLDEEVTRAKAAEAENAAAAKKAQDEVDALEILVGVLPEGTTATSVVEYVNKKTEGIATDAALGELNSQVSGLQTAVQGIQADYLKASDKTELSDAIGAEKTRAEGIEGGLRTDVDAIKADYLKAVDKTELQGNIDTIGGKVTTLIGEDAGKSARTIANEELAKQLIAEGAKESLDTLGEIAAWIQSHPDDASAMNKAIEDLEALVGALPEGVTATTIVGYVQEAVAAEKTRAEGIEAGLTERIEALETSVGDGGSVEDMISEAVAAETQAREAAISTLTETVGTKAAQSEVDTISGKVGTLETDMTQAKTDIDNVEAKAAGNETAIGQLQTAVNGKVAQGDFDSAVARVAKNETDIAALQEASATHALAADLTAAVERIAKNETDIAANASAIGAFTAITSEEVNALFA